MKSKNILLMVVSCVLVATIAIGGTVAYLQDDDSDVNVMTVGNVTIEQIEQQLDENGNLVPFVQAKELYPGTGVSKIVTVKNTGASDAYFRTLIAFEDVPGSETFGVDFPINEAYRWSWGAPEATIVVNGVTYQVYEAVYNQALKAGETSPASLTKVEFAKTCTNEDMEKLGGTYDILVVSQAVQTASFANAQSALDEAFGDITATNHPWVIPEVIENAEQLAVALAIPGNIMFGNDIKADSTISENISVEINLADKALDGIVMNNGDMSVLDGELKGAYIQNNGNATFTNVTVNAGTPTDYSNISTAGSETTYNNVEITSGGGGIGATNGAKVVFNSGSVAVNSTSTSGRYNIYAVGNDTEVIINGGEFSFSSSLNQKRAYIFAGAGATVYVNGGTFGPASTRSGYTTGILGDGTVIITGGTFGFDPSNWVAEGYQAVETNGVWTVSKV